MPDDYERVWLWGPHAGWMLMPITLYPNPCHSKFLINFNITVIICFAPFSFPTFAHPSSLLHCQSSVSNLCVFSSIFVSMFAYTHTHTHTHRVLDACLFGGIIRCFVFKNGTTIYVHLPILLLLFKNTSRKIQVKWYSSNSFFLMTAWYSTVYFFLKLYFYFFYIYTFFFLTLSCFITSDHT